LYDLSKFNAEFEAHPQQQIKLQLLTGIFKYLQRYDRIDAQGAREEKMVFRVTPAAAFKIGDVRDVVVKAQIGISSSKKYVSQVLFTGGRLVTTESFLAALRSVRGNH